MQEKIETQLRDLSTQQVETLARQALSTDTARLLNWQYEPIDVNTGAVTGGLYRVSGLALVGGREARWSTVLKVVSCPDTNAPSIYLDVNHDLYWKREVLAYQSGLLGDLPGGLEAARCLFIEERPNGSIWLWLEDLKDAYGAQWSLDHFAFAATTLGRFNGAYLTGRPLPDYPWLLRGGSPRGLLDHSTEFRDVVRDPQTWEHPLLRAAFPMPIADRLLRLWSDRNILLDVFERLPQTLCHMDAWRANLFIPEPLGWKRRLVGIDWAFVGSGTVGTDASDLFSPSFGLFRVEPVEIAAFDDLVFASYLEGLHDAGWQGDRSIVRFAFATLPSVKYGCYTPWIADAGDESKHATWERLSRRSMSEFLHSQATLLYYLLDLADEARALLDYVTIGI